MALVIAYKGYNIVTVLVCGAVGIISAFFTCTKSESSKIHSDASAGLAHFILSARIVIVHLW